MTLLVQILAVVAGVSLGVLLGFVALGIVTALIRRGMARHAIRECRKHGC